MVYDSVVYSRHFCIPCLDSNLHTTNIKLAVYLCVMPESI